MVCLGLGLKKNKALGSNKHRNHFLFASQQNMNAGSFPN